MLTLRNHVFSALMLCLLAVIGGASAADYTRQPGNGAWNDPNLWSPVGVPGASDNARIESSAGNITFTASATVGLLDVAGTYTGTIALGSYTLTASQVSFAGGTFNGETGALVCNGSFAIAGGVFNAPPALTFKGNVTIPSGTFNHGNGAALFAANHQAAQNIAAGTAVFNHVTIKGNSISVTTIQDDLHVDGDLSLETTSSSGCALNGGRILAKKNVTMASSGVGTWDHPGNAWIVLCGTTDQTLNGAASGRFTNIRIDKPSGVLHLAGLPQVFGSWDWVTADGLNAGTSSITFATPYNTVVSIKGGPVSYGDVTFKGWGQYSKHDLAGDLLVGGDLTFDMVAYTGNQVNGASFVVAGDVIMNNAGFGSASWGPGNSTIKLAGSGNHAIIANSSGHFPNMLIDTTGSVTTVGDVTVGGNWTFVNGTFTQGAGTLEFQAPYGGTRTILPGTVSYGNVTITGNGLSNQSVAGTLKVAGKFILTSAGYVGAKLNDGTVEVQGDFELPGDGFGASDGGPGSAVIRLAGTGNQTVTAGGLARCPMLEIDASGTVTFVGGLRLGAHYLHTSGTVQVAGSTQTFVGRAHTLITGAAVFGDLVIHKGPYGAGYTVTLEGAAQASGGLTVTMGILKFADNASLAVAGDVAVGAADTGVTAGTNSTLALNGSAAQNINLSGKTVFNLNVANALGAINFTAPYTAQGTTSAVPGATLIFASGSTFSTGKLAMNGTQAQGITLRASTAGSAAGIVAAPYQFVRHAGITDLNAASGPKVVALHSTDGGNNQNIIFQAAALLNLAAGNTSVTSPAWVEGVSGPDVTSLTVALNGEAPFPASRLNPTQYYGSNQASGHALGIELSAAAATNVEIAASNAFGESNTATQNIAWAATDLAGKSYSTDQLKIRINSKLRFVLDNHDSNVGETVRIDTNNDGTFEYTGVEGESIEHLFSASGSVIVRGEIGGLAVGSMTVIVVDTNLHGPVACQKGYERGLDVFALPATEAANIVYAAADPYALGLTVTQVTSDGALIKLKPTTMDSPYFVSRLGDATGPVIDIQPLMVFTVKDLNSHVLGFAVDSTGYGRAIARYQITPRTVIDNDNPVTTAQEGLYFDLGCMGTDMVFAENGQSTLRVHSNRQDADGIFEVETLLAPTGTFVCHSIQPRQINSNYTVGDYLYHNPCVMKAAGGLYLHREMSDETTREDKTNLYADGHNEAGKQIFQVWDQDVEKDKRWTSEIEVNDFTPQAMEAAFFNTRARKKVLPNRHFTVKVEQPGNSYLFAVRMVPGTTGIKGGADIDDNTGVDRDEILYEREPNLPENYLQWTGGFPSAYPALNLPPNHWGHDYQDPSKQYKSWDGPFQRYSTSPWYTDIGFWKGNMIGKMTVWGTCHPAVGLIPRAHVLPNVRPGAPTNPHTNSTFTSNDLMWGGEETEFRDILKFGRLEADGYLETDIPASGSGQSSTTADISSRNAFPEFIGANVITVFEANPPEGQSPKKYLRTTHDHSNPTCAPIPVQISFRAPPGTSVRAGVSVAQRYEKDDPQTPQNEIDNDGKKTHRAWVHLSDHAVFEYRGQPGDADDVKANKVFEILSFNPDGTIENEKPAERVVKISLTANDQWLATQTLYLYGIEPTQKMDELKLVVWGEEVSEWKAYPKEVQTHHYQNSELDPNCPIRRWYITDEEPINVVKYVWVDKSSGQEIESCGIPIREQSIDVRITNPANNNGPVPLVMRGPNELPVVHIEGTVEDLVAKKANDPSIKPKCYVNGAQVKLLDQAPGSYTFAADVPVLAGDNTITVSAANIGGMGGSEKVVIRVTDNRNGLLVDPLVDRIFPEPNVALFDPYRVRFNLPTPLSSTQADSITLDIRRILTPDITYRSVQVTELPPSTFIRKWGTLGTNGGQFNSPAKVAVDQIGNIFVADRGNNRIQKFDSTGVLLLEWGATGSGDGEFNSPSAICIDNAGMVFVADTNNHRIQRFTNSGNYVSKFGSPGTGDGEFNAPQGVCVDNEGNIYVADTQNHRIQKFNASGVFQLKWGTSGAGDGQFSLPADVTCGTSDTVVVADSGNNRIQSFSTDGVYRLQWGSSGTADGQLNNPAQVQLDSFGRVWVTDALNHRIQRFSPEGTFEYAFGANGSGDGQFITPSGLAVSADGGVYVSDSGNNRIEHFVVANQLVFRSADGTVELALDQAPSLDPLKHNWTAGTFSIHDGGSVYSYPVTFVENGVDSKLFISTGVQAEMSFSVVPDTGTVNTSETLAYNIIDPVTMGTGTETGAATLVFALPASAFSIVESNLPWSTTQPDQIIVRIDNPNWTRVQQEFIILEETADNSLIFQARPVAFFNPVIAGGGGGGGAAEITAEIIERHREEQKKAFCGTFRIYGPVDLKDYADLKMHVTNQPGLNRIFDLEMQKKATYWESKKHEVIPMGGAQLVYEPDDFASPGALAELPTTVHLDHDTDLELKSPSGSFDNLEVPTTSFVKRQPQPDKPRPDTSDPSWEKWRVRNQAEAEAFILAHRESVLRELFFDMMKWDIDNHPDDWKFIINHRNADLTPDVFHVPEGPISRVAVKWGINLDVETPDTWPKTLATKKVEQWEVDRQRPRREGSMFGLPSHLPPEFRETGTAYPASRLITDLGDEPDLDAVRLIQMEERRFFHIEDAVAMMKAVQSARISNYEDNWQYWINDRRAYLKQLGQSVTRMTGTREELLEYAMIYWSLFLTGPSIIGNVAQHGIELGTSRYLLEEATFGVSDFLRAPAAALRSSSRNYFGDYETAEKAARSVSKAAGRIAATKSAVLLPRLSNAIDTTIPTADVIAELETTLATLGDKYKDHRLVLSILKKKNAIKAMSPADIANAPNTLGEYKLGYQASEGITLLETSNLVLKERISVAFHELQHAVDARFHFKDILTTKAAVAIQSQWERRAYSAQNEFRKLLGLPGWDSNEVEQFVFRKYGP